MLEPSVFLSEARVLRGMLCSMPLVMRTDGAYWVQEWPKKTQHPVISFGFGIGCPPADFERVVKTVMPNAIDQMIKTAKSRGANTYVERRPPRLFLRQIDHSTLGWAVLCRFRGLFLEHQAAHSLAGTASNLENGDVRVVDVGWPDIEGWTVHDILNGKSSAPSPSGAPR